eukprot:TRINITY_DN214_c0_g2_i2.p1 TRINITY_DN214_c0_g2~~TRINITY_DN214_c0_g2_i2.p1  ORF type:complete len:387 (-),score=35.69 TRINITY_DN214_c0_g2_i2:24-1127(-)
MNPKMSLLCIYVLLCRGIMALQKIQSKSKFSRSSPTVAALVPVYENDFPYLEKFMKQWDACREAQTAMTLLVVFSSSTASQAFKTQMDAAGVSSSSWSALLISTGDDQFTGKKKPAAWKKLDALAQVLDAQKFPGLEFAIMMDSEIALNSCEGFADVPNALRAKFNARVWYADPGFGSVSPHAVNAANAIMVDCSDPVQSARLLEQTKDLKVNTWWQDVPWVELNSARRMYSMWSDMLSKNQTYRTCDSLKQVALDSGLMTPTEVSGSMGLYPPPLEHAGFAFEHLIYQYYMVVHEGFRIEVLKINDVPGPCGLCSFAEMFWTKDAKEQDLYMSTVKPLWVKSDPAGALSFAPPNGTAVLQFHTDRR